MFNQPKQVDLCTKEFRIASMSMLRAGIAISEDIYSFDGKYLLAQAGNTLSQERINRLKAINQDKDSIYVSNEAYEKMVGEQITQRRMNLEEETGFGAVKEGTVQIFAQIAKEKGVDTKEFVSVSREISARLKHCMSDTVLSLINALAPVDEYLYRHCINTGMLNGMLGRWMELPQDRVDRLVLIGLLHDTGKAAIPSSILNAPRQLTIAEFEVMKTHSVKSFDLLDAFPASFRRSVRAHHEKIDGTGYPDGLRGSDIPIEARITAISDIYDAMVSRRAYKEPHSPFAVLAMLNRMAGTKLDAQIVKIFIQNVPADFLSKEVLMSDGRVATISSFDPQNIQYPSVIIDGEHVQTDENLYPTSMF